jgi:ATP-dependent protease ClpP protease subunit
MAEVIAYHAGQTYDKVRSDMDRDYFMTPEESREYGIIDQVITPRRGLAVPQQTLRELGQDSRTAVVP